jgi:glycosyltransferase involved in cell wall biosynthesis
MRPLSDDNLTVHGLWIGSTLSRLELLTIRSFIHFGHEFHLWLYNPIENNLPAGVFVRDAETILPMAAIFKNNTIDPITGVGKGSLGAFSDLFRYKLLAEHGGIWVDMDVTCLQRFDFAEAYWFRTHRIGVVGNIMKCPSGSELMRVLYQAAASSVDAASQWLAANQLLSEYVAALGLSNFVHDDLCNPDDWRVVRPMIEGFRAPPDQWVAIHWGHEFWRSVGSKEGLDKESPPPGSLLHELYRVHGVIDPFAPVEVPEKVVLPLRATTRSRPALHVNMLVPRLVRGGAERIALETTEALNGIAGCTATLYVRRRTQLEYAVPNGASSQVMFLNPTPGRWEEDWIRDLAMSVLHSASPVLFTHMVQADILAALWRWSVLTVPVIHNASHAWLDPPAAYDHENVPFIVAVSETVASELRGQGCRKPVVVVQHELQRSFDARFMAQQRWTIRDRYGIGRNTLLIGMIGQFKTQKAYTRAVRVLAEMRGICDVRLMILGGWDHGFGGGRTAYEAVCRLAVELGVIADMIMPGDVDNAENYLAAFDVFLNTSIHEGRSVALLEAVAAGCPIVAADAGGNAAALSPGAVMVPAGADIDAYVAGICGFLRQTPRFLPAPRPSAKLAPLIWGALARHASERMAPALPVTTGVLFITANLHIGGAQRSLVNLLEALPTRTKTALCVLGGMSGRSLTETLRRARIPVTALGDVDDRAEQAAICLEIMTTLRLKTVCFWNCPAEVKLILAKLLQWREIRLIDVSPGPMLFDAMAEVADFSNRLAFNPAAYFARLDHFVAKYQSGVPVEVFGKATVIPNGVKLPPRFVPLPPPAAMLPKTFDPDLAIGTCCRVVPDKKIEFLLEMMTHLQARIVGASLTIVGAPEGEGSDYYQALLPKLAARSDIRLVGHHDDVNPLLARFQVFVMVSARQGCPNASLEAMAMGLPVVANRDGGIAEQVDDGVNGFLVETPEEMAARVEELLRMPIRRRQFGAASRRRAEERFSMTLMAARYRQLLELD